MPPPPIVVIDGSFYLFRAFYALPPLTASSGEPTGAVYGVVNMVRRLLADYRPERAAVVFDAPGKTFRHALYPRYKANRPAMPEELRAQIAPLHALIRALGLPLISHAGVEANVIGTLAEQARAEGAAMILSSGDKDLAQLVDDRITLINTMTDATLDAAGVEKKFGVPPHRIVDWLALTGDASDNIPGVPGVGPKTAAKWLARYGSLDALIERREEVGGKAGENLRAHLEQVRLARTLTTIDREVELPLTLDDLHPAPPDVDALRALYRRLEFESWLRLAPDGADGEGAADESGDAATEAQAATPLRCDIIADWPALEAWIERLEGADCFALDTETTSLHCAEAEIVGLSFAIEPGRAAYLPLAHVAPTGDLADLPTTAAPRQLERAAALQRLRPLLEDAQRRKVGQNLKYDMNVLANHGIALTGAVWDTMIESYVLDSGAARHDLDSLARKHLEHETIRYADVVGKGKKQIPFAEVPIAKAAAYAAEDAEVALRLHRALYPRIAGDEKLRALFHEIEMPLLPVLSRMERTGVRVDAALLRTQSAELGERLKRLEQQVFETAGVEFNLASPKQIQEVLYDRLGLPVRKKTPKGQPSTAESVLQELALDYPLPRLILEHRGLSKLKSTYADALPLQIHPRTGRIHTSWRQTGAATGRFSSSDPNLQNIPIRTAEGRRIRRAFIAAPGQRLAALDYSQIELRIMAHLSGDARLLAAFAAGVDIHRATAAEIFATPPEQVDDDQRRSAKAINFGLIYGMSPFGLARQLGIPHHAAQDYVERYFQRYPGVKTYMETTRERAAVDGFVETLFGRRLYLPEIRARSAPRRQQAERAAINAPMQGTAADLIKRAMIDIDRWLEAERLPARMIMQVHDELVFEVAEEAVDALVAGARERMERAGALRVPLAVDVGVGANWDEAH